MTETKFGTFDELMQDTASAMRPVARALRALVFATDPHTTEVVRLGDRAATYGVGPRKMKEGYVYVLPYKDYVNFGFFSGASLPDPDGRLEGTGAKMRHIKVRSLAAIDAGLTALLVAAIAERRAAVEG